MTPSVRILGDPDIHVKEGSKVNIECVISNTTDHVPYVTWIFNNQVKTEINSCDYLRKESLSVLNDEFIQSQNL